MTPKQKRTRDLALEIAGCLLAAALFIAACLLAAKGTP